MSQDTIKPQTITAIVLHILVGISAGLSQDDFLFVITLGVAAWLVFLFFRSIANYKTHEGAKTALKIHVGYLIFNLVGLACLDSL